MRNILVVVCFFCFCCPDIFAQNGLYVYDMPQISQTTELRYKTAISSDSSGNVYVAFRAFGFGKFDPVSQNWVLYNTQNSPLPTDSVTALVAFHDEVWLGVKSFVAGNSRLFRFKGNQWTDFSFQIDTALLINSISFSGNQLWVATTKGAYRNNGNGFAHYTVAGSGLPSDTVRKVSVTTSGEFLFATNRGLGWMQNSVCYHYHVSNGLSPIDDLRDVYSDSRNGTWIAGAGGTAAFTGLRFEKTSDLYPTPSSDFFDPLSSASYSIGSITKSPQGGILIPRFSYGGLVELRSDTINSYYYPTKILSGSRLLMCTDKYNQVWIIHTLGISGNPFKLLKFDGQNYYYHDLITNYNNSRYLDVNHIKAAILNRGDLHWNGEDRPAYEAPAGAGTHPVFASAFWIGGLDTADTIHIAAIRYRQGNADFSPGPLDTVSGTTDSVTAYQFDRLWKINKTEILAFQYHFSNGNVQNGSYKPSHDFLTWPAHGTGNYSRSLAPFVDVNANGIYDPLAGGDYPSIKGDQAIFTIFNDRFPYHSETGGRALGAEIHLMAYAYYCNAPNASDSVMNYTTYYHYKIFNRSADNYHHVYIGRFQDSDLGFYNDDYVGCNPEGNFGFTYNGSPNDGGSPTPSPGAYGAQPPYASYVVLDGPIAEPFDSIDNNNNGVTDEAGEKNLMTNFQYYNGMSAVDGEPQNASDFYDYLHSVWTDGRPVTYGGNGIGGNTPTRFMYSGEPFDTTWCESNIGNTPADRRMIVSTGPFSLPSNSSVEYTGALVYSRSMTIPYATSAYFNMVKTDIQKVQNWFAAQNEPSCVQWNVGIVEPPLQNDVLLYPNPASQTIFIEYEAEENNALYEFYDLTGRKIETGPLRSASLTPIYVASFPPGVYLLRIVDGQRQLTRKWVKQ